MKSDIITKLEEKLSFSQAVFRIVSSFVSLDAMNTVIDKALKNLGEACNASRSYLFLFKKNDTVMDNSNEWCQKGVTPQINNLQNLPADMFPWWMKKLKNHESIHIQDVGKMPPVAEAEKKILQEQDIKSILVLPVYIHGIPRGFVGLDNVLSSGAWEKESLEYLHVASNIISSALSRDKDEKLLIQRNKELEKTNHELKRTQAQLIQSEKLAGIGQLAAGVAHEINNPIGYISSNHETLFDYIKTLKNILNMYRNEVRKEKIHAVEEAQDMEYLLKDIDEIAKENMDGLKRVTEIVSSLKDFSRIDNNKFDKGDINQSIKNTLLVIHNEVKYVSKVHTEYGYVPVFFFNRGQINQVLLNIFLNASQAIQEWKNEKQGLINVKTYSNSEYVIIEITDNGPGIKKNNLDKIFDPFFTTKEVGKGTGLGLNICYDIVVNKHKGKLLVESREGAGASFIIKLPVNQNV